MWKSRFLPLRPSVESSKAFPITNDGETGVVSNGVPDWVYEGESMAGRCYPRSQFAHRRHSTGCPLSSWNWVGLTLILVFHHLPSRFCQIPISPRRIGQTVEHTKYKSTRPSPRADGTPYNSSNFTIPTLCNEFITGGGFCWSCRFAILHCGRAQRKDLNKSIRVSMDTRNSNFLFPFRVRVSVALLNQFCLSRISIPFTILGCVAKNSSFRNVPTGM